MQTFIEEVNTNLDAFDIYSLFKQDKTVSLLDSGMNAENLGRYSFIGLNPFTTFKYENGSCFINGKKIGEADPFEEIKKLLGMYKIKNDTSFPYIAGAMGYFSYDLARIIEKLPVSALDDVKIPDCYFYFYDNAIIFDNLKGDTFITALGILKNPKNSIKELKEKILKGNQVKYKEVEGSSTKFISNFEKNKYKKTVEKVRNYIREGDIYITNLTQRFKCKVTKKPYEIYRDLRHINPAPFAAFMNVEDFSIISSSPERFLKIENNIVQTRPIKGTRPRGKNKEEDIRNRQELADSGKDHSELLMIVDLERNDLSKVCRPNSVKVKNLFTIEEYSTVFHLVSTITGKLKQNNTSIDCLKACFPGGSITGAPKVRAMEIIEELEPTRRGIYTGSIGYLGFDGNIDLNIVIRTILIKNGMAYFGVGGGITWESDKTSEYDETLDKALALMKVL
ncbi:aminodeoxychorismate synthase component I [Clostridium luticellarii]|nr:aminodeoxychorismate synthase component I [Clostridium luticellarii]MCI1945105.1 aminodeoxychorismate synthase component I [Clostridium luticellarii]MCI1968598.1 aminodeoxychorismate synthase component I [Clostridium luticellarii]MCI1995902.1 aminodeoxychorismate synthase component I [Clostridium luticellarii]MCI2040997.1 aminodeoxychorismate synthase component I [Clostridium luticellarii]